MKCTENECDNMDTDSCDRQYIMTILIKPNEQ